MAISIAVAGKGGTGKTSLAALMIACLVERNLGPVLAIDADPDSNLGRFLGRVATKTVGDLREEVRRELADFPAGMTKAGYVEARLHELVDEAAGFDLLTMGKGEGSGCYCYLNSLIRKFSDTLTPSYSWVVMDNEAGLEHISRRTTSNIDHLIVVVNSHPASFDTARKISQIVTDLKSEVRHRYVVTNMIEPQFAGRVKELVNGLGMQHLADIPRDPILEQALFDGIPVQDFHTSKAKDAVYALMSKIGGADGTA